MKKYILTTVVLLSALNISYACPVKTKVISQNGFNTHVAEYLVKSSDELVLILPPTGGENFIDRSYAQNFCDAGINAVIIKNWTGDDEYNLELEIHTRYYNRAQHAIKQVINEYQGFQLSILGTSVGGLHASIALARLKEIKKGVLIVSGGDIASIIANTNQDILVEAKKKRFRLFNFKNNEEYVAALRAILPYEPLKINFDSSEKKIGMVISTNDDIVPTRNQMKLKRKWNPTIISSSWLGHTATVVKTWLFNSSEIINFFK